MLNVLLIWWFGFFGTPDQFPPPLPLTPETYFCYEYDLRVEEGLHLQTNKICYISPLTKTRRKHILTVKTDSIEVSFAVLRSFPLATRHNSINKGAYTGTLTYAVILGEPNQLYSLHEEIRVEETETEKIRYYVFSFRPIQQSRRTGPVRISGRVLEVSTREICEKKEGHTTSGKNPID